MDTWDVIKADRESFADFLAGLSPAEWNASSWCAGWSVKDVALHLLVTSKLSKGKIFTSFVKAGFNLDKMTAKLIGQMTKELSAEQVLADARATAGSRSAPPGLKPIGVLAEVLVHGCDVSMALGKPLDFPVDHYVMGLDHMKGVQPVLGCKKRIAGLKLQATDTTWSTGEGPVVAGPAKLLLAAMTGRRQACASLTGEGVTTLSSR